MTKQPKAVRAWAVYSDYTNDISVAVTMQEDTEILALFRTKKEGMAGIREGNKQPRWGRLRLFPVLVTPVPTKRRRSKK